MISGHHFDGDAVEREQALAAFAHSHAGRDLVEGFAVEFDGLASLFLIGAPGEDSAKAVVHRFFDLSQQAHGIKCNCWAAMTRSPAMGAAAVPP